MRRLFPVNILEDETLTSFCSRFAFANARTAYELCLDFGFSFRQIIAGQDAAINTLSDLCGVPISILQSAAAKHVDSRHIVRAGERTPFGYVSRTGVRYCPDCLRDDEAQADRRPGTRRYGRKLWTTLAVRTCPIHSTSLVAVGTTGNPDHQHDFCYLLRHMRMDMARAAKSSIPQSFSPFEGYVSLRLREQKIGNDLLDGLPLHVATDLCELAGMTELHGRKFTMLSMTDSQRWEASQRGFELFKDGKDGLDQFLERLLKAANFDGKAFGGHQLYGNFYTFLSSARRDAGFAPLRRMVTDFTLERVALPPNRPFLGRSVEPRYLTFHALAKEHGFRERTLRKMARSMGKAIVMPGSDYEIIAVADANDVVESLSDLITSPEASDLLGVDKRSMLRLVNGGILSTRAMAGDDDLVARWYSRSQIARLMGSIMPARPPQKPYGLASIKTIAHSLKCKQSDIIGLIRDGKIKNVSVDHANFGINSLLVDRDEIAPLIQIPDHGCFTPDQLVKLLYAQPLSIAGLLKHGHLATRQERDQTVKGMRRVISPETLASFRDQYISLNECSALTGINNQRVMMQLATAEVVRAFPKDQVTTPFYPRYKAMNALALASSKSAH